MMEGFPERFCAYPIQPSRWLLLLTPALAQSMQMRTTDKHGLTRILSPAAHPFWPRNSSPFGEYAAREKRQLRPPLIRVHPCPSVVELHCLGFSWVKAAWSVVRSSGRREW